MKRFVAFVAAFASATLVFATPAAERGGVLADGKGRTLYVFKKDSPMQSACYDGCARAWPPFIASTNAKEEGDFSILNRKDGGRQWAFKGQPLYFYAGDTSPGEATGDGSGSVWYVIRSSAAQTGKNVSQGY